MKKLLIPMILVFALIFSACTAEQPSEIAKAKTITYQSENGPIEVPAEPERVVHGDGGSAVGSGACV